MHAERTKFRIPAGYVIPPGERLLVWADDETSQNSSNALDLHVNFKLSKNGDGIGLFAPDGTVIDFISFGAQAPDTSQGRYPDGSGTIMTSTLPTPRTTNYVLLPNTAPVISPLSNYVIFEGQLLAISVFASDTDYPPQSLSFSLLPGTPAGASINSDTGLFSWRPSPADAPSTNSIAVSVTDDGLPPLSSTAAFTVQVAPRPRLTSLQFQADGNAITFVTVPTKKYQVQFKHSLLDADWVPIGLPTTATGETLTLYDETASGSQRFYRIVASE